MGRLIQVVYYILTILCIAVLCYTGIGLIFTGAIYHDITDAMNNNQYTIIDTYEILEIQKNKHDSFSYIMRIDKNDKQLIIEISDIAPYCIYSAEIDEPVLYHLKTEVTEPLFSFLFVSDNPINNVYQLHMPIDYQCKK